MDGIIREISVNGKVKRKEHTRKEKKTRKTEK